MNMNHINNNNNSDNSSNNHSIDNSSSNSNNNNNNYQQHEIILWKVFKNIYLRDIILSSIHNNNKSRCHNSYNSTTSLELMLKNNKYNMIIDKLKSNHFIHFTKLPDLFKINYNNNNIPIDKAKEIQQLLFNQYKDHIKRIDPFKGIGEKNQQLYIQHYKLLYGQHQQNQNNNNNNNYNNYRAHSLFYSLLDGYNSNNQNTELIKYLKQVIDSNNNNNDNDEEHNYINKKQKTTTSITTTSNNSSSGINNSSNSSNSRQDYIQKLITTSSSSSSPSSKSIKNEIIDAIYNNKPIPISLHHYYLNQINSLCYSNQDIVELKLDIKSYLILNHNKNIYLIGCIGDQEILELVLLKLLYHHHTIAIFNDTYWEVKDIVYSNYNLGPVDSLILAKIFCLNIINKKLRLSGNKSSSSSLYLKFKQHLIDNQIGTLDELISAASDTFIDKDGDIEQQMNEHFGIYYCYYKSTKPIQVKQCISSNITMSLAFTQSIINQSGQIFSKLSINDLEQFIEIPFKRLQSKYINSVGSGFGSSDGDGIGNQDESIKQRTTSYFNLLIKTINGLIDQQDNSYTVSGVHNNNITINGLNLKKIYGIKNSDASGVIDKTTFKFRIWIRIFEIIIFNYNAKLLEWLLESNYELQDIYYELLYHKNYNYNLLVAHTRINKESNQIDGKMFNVFIYQINNTKKKDMDYIKEYGPGCFGFFNRNSPQVSISLINHLTLLVSTSSDYNHPYIFDIIRYFLSCFDRLELVDEFIQIYNQLNPIENKLDKEKAFSAQSMIQVSTVLLLPLLISINKLDIKSINKIISAVLNNSNNNNNRININIPTTIDNSLDLIKYLFKNGYLNQFYNFEDLIWYIVNHIQGVDKEFIMELVNTYIDNPYEIERLKKRFSNKYEKEKREEQDVQLSLERLKCSLDSTQQQQQQQQQDQDSVSRDIVKCFTNGYYDSVYNFLNNNNNNQQQQQLDIDSTGREEIFNHLSSHPISIEWFTKLYPVLFKRLLDSSIISSILDSKASSLDIHSGGIKALFQFNHQIFEFIWDNYFNNDQERIEFIIKLLLKDQSVINDSSYHQIIEYILKSKREFIISSTKYSSLYTYQIHHDTLVYGNLSIYKQVRSIFPSYQFTIDYQIIRKLIKSYSSRYDVIEYLYENNLLPNLDQFINTNRLENIFIQEYDGYKSYKKHKKEYGSDADVILVTKSMFILIITIIKLQRQQQQQITNDTK